MLLDDSELFVELPELLELLDSLDDPEELDPVDDRLSVR